MPTLLELSKTLPSGTHVVVRPDGSQTVLVIGGTTRVPRRREDKLIEGVDEPLPPYTLDHFPKVERLCADDWEVKRV